MSVVSCVGVVVEGPAGAADGVVVISLRASEVTSDTVVTSETSLAVPKVVEETNVSVVVGRELTTVVS